MSLITACALMGNVEEALQEAARTRDVFLRLGEYYWVCIIDHNTAIIYDHIGRYQDALELYKSMMTIYPTVANQSETSIKRSVALAEMNLAIHLAWFDNFEEAYGLHQQAQASFIALEETSLVIYTETQLAALDYAQGYYGSALRRYYQASDSLIQSSI